MSPVDTLSPAGIDYQDITDLVCRALAEDLGPGDLTAALVPAEAHAEAQVISREHAVLCGSAWLGEVFRQLDPEVKVHWLVADGASVAPDQMLCRISGRARPMLSGERTALNLLQTLSGTATTAGRYAAAVAGTQVRLLDTRKTLPGLRSAQKYAVRCGGCRNHRMGLYDAFLIKENHIRACGSVAGAIRAARAAAADKPVEVEVRSLGELREALAARADIVLLDNFGTEQLREATHINAGRARLEASGGATMEQLREIAATGVDYISVGALTKHVRAVDLSMLFD